MKVWFDACKTEPMGDQSFLSESVPAVMILMGLTANFSARAKKERER